MNRILNKIKNPEHVLLLLSSAKLEKSEEIRKALELYRKTNPWYLKNPESEDEMAACCLRSTLCCASRDVLYNWAVCRGILQLHSKGEHFAFLRKLVEEKEEVKKAFLIPR